MNKILAALFLSLVSAAASADYYQILAGQSGGGGSGTVTSLTCGTGLNGGTITVSGTCSANFGTASGTIAQGNDTRFPASVTGIRKGAGAGSADTAAVSGTDYAPATTGSSILKASSGGFANAVAGTDYVIPSGNITGSAGSLSAVLACLEHPALTGDVTTASGSCATTDVGINGVILSSLSTGILKITTGTGAPSIAVSGTDYAPATTGTSILKASSGGFANAVAGTDYVIPSGSITGNAATATALAATPSGCSGNNFAVGIAANGNLTCAQPAFSNLSGSVVAGQMPALTGDVTTSAGSVATTVKALNGTTLSALATGPVCNTTSTGVPYICVTGTDLKPSTVGILTNSTPISAFNTTNTAGLQTITNANITPAASTNYIFDAQLVGQCGTASNGIEYGLTSPSGSSTISVYGNGNSTSQVLRESAGVTAFATASQSSLSFWTTASTNYFLYISGVITTGSGTQNPINLQIQNETQADTCTINTGWMRMTPMK